MEMKLLEVCKVTPTPNSPTNDISFPLTFFDLLNFDLPPIEFIWFYETPPSHPHPVLVSKLKHALSLTLRHFLPASGYLVWPQSSPKPIIRYKNGDGVLLTVTETDADFHHLSSQKIRKSRSYQPFIARIVKSGTQVPLIAFKITLFPNKRICLGVSIHHSLFDSTSFTLLMNSWAYFVKLGENGGLCRELTPVLDREVIRKRYSKLESLYLETFKQNGVTSVRTSYLRERKLEGIVTGTFVLSDLDVRNLKGLVSAQLKDYNGIPHISTFAVAYAYVILCLIKVVPPKNNKINVYFAYECNKRLEPPVSKNYFGNCVGLCNKYFDTEELKERDGMAMIVNFISKSMDSLVIDGALKGAEEWLSNIYKSAVDSETMKILVAGSSRFEYQSIDFGWGRPTKVDMPSIDGRRMLFFAQGKDENKGGIEVNLSLNESDMEKFSYLFDQGLRDIKRPIKASL